jgi:hypothetical protein
MLLQYVASCGYDMSVRVVNYKGRGTLCDDALDCVAA